MLTSTNPATGAQIGAYEELSKAEVEAKIAAAASCFEGWRKTSYEERTALLGKIADA